MAWIVRASTWAEWIEVKRRKDFRESHTKCELAPSLFQA